MPQSPRSAWFLSSVAAVLSLLIWGERAWPAETPDVLRGACYGALPGAALVVGAWVGALWARRGQVRFTFVPMCLMLATLATATGLVDGFGAPPIGLALFGVCSLMVAVGQASMFVALVHAGAPDGVVGGELGPVLALQMAGAVVAAGVCRWALGAGQMLLVPYAAAALWVAAAGLFALKRAAAATAKPTARVSMASLLRHRRWPLLGVAALCGGLAACTPTLWMQSLQCLSGFTAAQSAVPMLLLLGYALGAKVAAVAAQKPATVRLALAITLMGCAAFFLLGMIYFDTLPTRVLALTRIGGDAIWRRVTLEVLLMAMVVLPVSVSTGACLPLVAGAVGNGAPAGARTLARVLRAYGVGMVVGAALVPVLARYVGLEAVMRAAALLYTLGALVSSSAATPQRRVVRGLDAAALVTALAIASWPRWTVEDVQWPQFRESGAEQIRDGLQYQPSFDNMRRHARKSVLLEDLGSS